MLSTTKSGTLFYLKAVSFDSDPDFALRLEGIVLLPIIAARTLLAVMGHAHRDMPCTAAAKSVIRGERHCIDAAISCPSSLGPQEYCRTLHNGIWARVSVAKPVDGFILRHPRYGNRHQVVVRVRYPDDAYRHQFVIGRPEQSGIWPALGCTLAAHRHLIP